MRVADFRFSLPEELIAHHPPAERGASRMLVVDRRSGALSDRSFRDLPLLLRAGDLLIVNDSRVLPARLYATRVGASRQLGDPHPGGRIEVLLTHPRRDVPDGANEWHALVRPGRKVRVGDELRFAAGVSEETPLLAAEVVAAGAFGERILRFRPVDNFAAVVERIGHMPLPPYIARAPHTPDTAEDRDRYQTVYARSGGSSGSGAGERSAAAPTAGLHFTPELLAELRARGVEVASVTLHVGLGTFQPVRVVETEAIQLHAERFTISTETADAINRARAYGRRIIAVGTTTTRTLEHCARVAEGNGRRELEAGSGETSLFLSPGAEFRVVSGLLTNFHLPESTLLMLVSAFAGTEPVLRAYAHAVRERYRFFSYGDCMLLL